MKSAKISYPPRGSDYVDVGEVPRPVFGIDIDGTLGAYHEHFTVFASAWLGRDLPDVDGYLGGTSFSSYLGLSKTTYRKIKLGYRRGGLKRSMPVFSGAKDLSLGLRKRGAVVLLCTTRPYLSLENVDSDTRHWARRNGIQCDGITWGENKYKDLSRLGERVVAVYDDDPEMIRQALSCDIPAVLASRPYNSNSELTERIPISSVGPHLNGMLSKWEERFR